MASTKPEQVSEEATEVEKGDTAAKGSECSSTAGEGDDVSGEDDQVPSGYQAYGTTFDGRRFLVPETIDMLELLFTPKSWGLGEILVALVNTFNTLTMVLCRYIPTWYFIMTFLFWRVSYNVGIGYILLHQSRDFGFDRFLGGLRPEWSALLRKIATTSVSRKLEETGQKGAKFVPEFESWMVFRLVSTLILSNDGQTYCILAWKLLEMPAVEDITIGHVLCFVFGTIVCILSIFAKRDAHDCVGDYAWYWGDFWFRLETSLTFDGVFELFPHPMYTVGYLAYYGLSLITRSHTLLVVSLVAHSLQIFFLAFIEEPHIQKIYGSEEEKAKKVTTGRNELFGLANFFPYRYADISTAVLLGQMVMTALFLNFGSKFYILQLCLWRIAHWMGLGTIMYLQSTNQFWTNKFAGRGYTRDEAFGEWRKLYNTSTVMNNAAFCAFAFRVAGLPYRDLLHALLPENLACIVGGMLLITSSFFVVTSVSESLGPDSWYYGDLFLELKSYKPNYDGLYRYMDNPGSAFGYLGDYGLALLFKSWPLFWISFCSQALSFAFVYIVEVPHMGRYYKDMRESAGVQKLVNEQISKIYEVPVIKKLTDGVTMKTVRSWSKLCEGVESRNETFAVSAREAKAKLLDKRSEVVKEIRAVAEYLRNHQVAVHARNLSKRAQQQLMYLDQEILELAKRAGLLASKMELDHQAHENGFGSSTEGVEPEKSEKKTQ
eukprot:CAMPEP_0184742254 /NCGR_PEP_ID=MMETSP0315-20130426/5240_1 /TAXON_ID=101924 /ORGANISM="Rhodosorus marinus, Strain UTEX LB 2760" /LENGTH=716 /DNA_ID=CAMNT_0027213005 /DNA_START=86 /DNA_END=2236 /DNA_ORIENTATION=-